jgi:hypothetical protein
LLPRKRPDIKTKNAQKQNHFKFLVGPTTTTTTTATTSSTQITISTGILS